MDHLLLNKPNLISITETWLTSETNTVTADIKDYGYKFYHKIRNSKLKIKGGGVGTMVQSDIDGRSIPTKDYNSFECSITRVPLTGSKHLLMVVVYRLQYVPITEFLVEFEDMLDHITTLYDDVVIAGDVNIHMETNESSAVSFKELLEIHNLKQHVIGPTHIKGHTIDIVISPNRKEYIANVNVRQIEPHHHFLIEFNVNVSVLCSSMKTITFPVKKNVDNLALKKELKEKLDKRTKATNIAEHIQEYERIVSEIWDNHAPLRVKRIREVGTAPWFDNEYRSLRKMRRKAEKKFRRTKLEADRQSYCLLKKQAVQLAKTKKSSYITNKLKDGSSKALFSVVNSLTDKTKVRVLPTTNSDKELADKFLTFFKNKVQKIRNKFTEKSKSVSASKHPKQLSHFRLTDIEELSSIIKTHGIKCSPTDPIPADILTTHLDIFLPVWVEIVNISLITGDMSLLKNGVILPLIKELLSITDTDELKNYRPISNLLFISKLIERVVDIRLQEHLDRNDLNIENQYGYKECHSTEMLLLKVVNDLLVACDRNIPSVLLLLDLSAAFDTVDQEKLLDILSREIGVTDTALSWFRSFLTERRQMVKVGDAFSTEDDVPYGVPQGSILGPRLFNIYIRSLYSHVEESQFSIVGFADDHQLVKQFMVALQPIALGHSIRNCLASLSSWMNHHFLCLNEGKTKILVIAPPAVKQKIVIEGINFENTCIRFVNSANNLGVIINSILSFEEHVNKVIKGCYCTIKEYWKIKQFMTEKQLHQLVSSRILSQLDYCNTIYYGLPDITIQKLQRVQNSAARLVSKSRITSNNMDSALLEFHWLKVKYRTLFKILIIVHKCINQKAPKPVAALINISQSQRSIKLKETSYRSSYGARSFSHAGPKLWNLLPPSICEEQDIVKFKKLLKTFLMKHGDEFLAWTNVK